MIPSEAPSPWSGSENACRLFISYPHQRRQEAEELQNELGAWGIDSFVAQSDIPFFTEGKPLIDEALRTCHAFVALLCPEFRASEWCDQELGIAIGRGILLLPIMLTDDKPHGYLGRIQAMPWPTGTSRVAGKRFDSIIDALIQNLTTRKKIVESLVAAMEKSASFSRSNMLADNLMQPAVILTPGQMARLRNAEQENYEVGGSYDAPKAIELLASRFDDPFDDEEPF